jgi:beta-glucanase (GH16 family)
MMGVDHSHVGWPACGEIDIMEMGSTEGISDGLQSRCLTAACHWGPGWNDGAYPNYAKATIVSYTLQDDFHLYTLIWDNMSIKMYLDSDKYPDNPPYYELNISEKTTDTSPDNYFKKRFSILFNLAVGGNFTGIWDINQVTALAGGNAHMYVDYVKVYQKGND